MSTGYVKSVTTVCNEIYVEMRKIAKHLEHEDVMLRVHPDVAKELKANNGRLLKRDGRNDQAHDHREQRSGRAPAAVRYQTERSAFPSSERRATSPVFCILFLASYAIPGGKW